jgi:hypothetical protein
MALSRLTFSLAMVMSVQALLGLSLPHQYREVDWIRATWYGNDWVTLLAAVPLACAGAWLAAGSSVRGLLLISGIAAYGVYNYAFYLFGAALNPFFPLYVLTLLASCATLVLLARHLDVAALARSFRPETPVHVIGGYLLFVGLGLASIWVAMWGAYVFAGRPTPIHPETFKVVAALDLCLMAPALTGGGVLLWKRRPWGYLVATTASIQGALYLVVLSTNSAIAISRGLAVAPGELPIWVPLALLTTFAAAVLLASASGRSARGSHLPPLAGAAGEPPG